MNLHFKSTVLIVLMIFLMPATRVFAWGDLGHQTIGEVAEQILMVEDESTRNAIRSIVGVEPFAMAAAWPDHVRSDGRFNDFAPYHYVTIYKDPKKHTDKDAWTVFNKYPNVLTSNSASREAKIVAFRYLIHVVGDIQQPLHAGHEYDRGGNDCLVAWQPNAEVAPSIINLHAAWDTQLVDHMAENYKKLEPHIKYYGYKQLAKALMDKHKDIVAKPEKLSIQSWVKQSEELRKTVVYPDNFDDAHRPYCKRSSADVNPKDIPLLDLKYADSKSEIIEKQIVRGGVRLAVLLKEIFKGNKNKAPTEAEILELLKLHND